MGTSTKPRRRSGRARAARNTILVYRALARGEPLTTREATKLLGEEGLKDPGQLAMRVLKAIAEAGVDVVATGRGRDRKYERRPEQIGAEDGEMRAAVLQLAAAQFRHLGGTRIGEAIRSMSEGLLDRMTAETRARSLRLASRIHHLPEPGRNLGPKEEVIQHMLDALATGRRMFVEYEGEAYSEVHPWYLIDYRRALYLAAATEHGQRLFAVDRISDSDILASQAATRPDESLLDRLRSAFGIHPSGPVEAVVVRFGPKVRKYVEARTWHPSQRLERDGEFTILRMETSGKELLRWVLEWGEHAEVLEPHDLREAVRAELRGALRQYDATAPPRESGGEAPGTVSIPSSPEEVQA